MRIARLAAFATMAVLSAALTACAPTAVAPTASATPETPPTAEPSPAAIETGNPLTGLPVPADVLLRRPLIVKISNAPDTVRPQAALSQADHVYEHYVEAGLTRFSAVYLTNTPTRIGSIRSARLIDLELMPLYDGLLVYAGASDGVLGRLMAADFFSRTYSELTAVDLPIFSRDAAIDAPHNLFADASAAWAEAETDGHAAGARDVGLRFSDEVPQGAVPGRFTSLRYRATRVEWVYDADQEAYRRLVDGQPHLDALTSEPIMASNVVILYARHRETDIVESVAADGTNFYSLDIDLVGSGDALLLRDGSAYPLTWRRSSLADELRFVDADGLPMAFHPGTIWFQVFPLPEDWIPGIELARYG